MLGNIKEFLSVVQDGLSSNSNLRHTLEEVQKVKNIFKEKHIVNNDSKVNFGAGGALLDKYQKEWEDLHKNADNNAKSADEVDMLIVELHDIIKSRLHSATELADNLIHLPNLTASIAQCMNSIKDVHTLMRNVQEELVEFEDIVERNKIEKRKLDHHYQLTLYKNQKMAALEETRSKLVSENSKKNLDHEKKVLAEIQARREMSAMAFQQDITKYLATGSVPSASSEPPKITLEQVQLEEDHGALEKFLDS